MQTPEVGHFVTLEAAVGRVVERMRMLERQLDEARRRAAELDGVLGRLTGGDLPPSALLERLSAAEARNQVLEQRLKEGRSRVERLLVKIRFLEEQR